MIFGDIAWWWLVPCAFALDVLWGDPPLPWRHPVCWVGTCYAWLEPLARRCGAVGVVGGAADIAGAGGPGPGGSAGRDTAGDAACGAAGGTRLAGAVCVALVVALSGGVVYVLIHLPYVGAGLALYLTYAGLCGECLVRTGREVLTVLEHGTLADAQTALAMLVSRDTRVQGRTMLHKSLADTLAENHTDAIVAPLFWLVVGGPVGLWMYKAVSTADSMWGYTTPRWLRLGWAGAKLDDVLAYVPARLGVWFLRMADVLTHTSRHWGGSWPGYAVLKAQAAGMASPNSGWPMAATAWLLGQRMGGPTVYFGTLVNKPWVGAPDTDWRQWHSDRLAALCRLLRVSGVVACALLYPLGLALGWLVRG